MDINYYELIPNSLKMRGSTVILNVILLHIFMGSITVGINVIYVCCNVDVDKDCMFGNFFSNSCPSDEGTPAM